MSQRLVDQNLWNATLWNLRWDKQSEAALRAWGVDEFFEGLAAVFPYEASGPLTVPDNSAFTSDERQSLQSLVEVLNAAWDSRSGRSGDEFLKTDWPTQIRAALDKAVEVMRKRGGYFSTIHEEREPSIPHPTECPSTIFVPLLDEGVDVWRPVDAEPLADSRYRVLGPMPEAERWAFPPGALVKCEWKTFADGAGGMTAMAIER